VSVIVTILNSISRTEAAVALLIRTADVRDAVAHKTRPPLVVRECVSRFCTVTAAAGS